MTETLESENMPLPLLLLLLLLLLALALAAVAAYKIGGEGDIPLSLRIVACGGGVWWGLVIKKGEGDRHHPLELRKTTVSLSSIEKNNVKAAR